MEHELSPKQVAQAIGVSEASVKRWCDKGLVKAVRTEGGHRRLAIADVLEYLRRTGRRPLSADLLQMPASSSESPLDWDQATELVAAGLIAGDEALVQRVVMDLLLTQRSIAEIGDRVFQTALQRIGDKWECNEIDPYQERLACEICSRVIGRLRQFQSSPSDTAPLAIGGTLSGDHYRIPTILVELTLRELRWRAQSLGTGLPSSSLCAAIDSLCPDLFWLSVSHVESITEFLKSYQALFQHASDLGIPIVVGGRALDANLRPKMQYSAFCDNLQHLTHFVAGLNHRPAKSIRRSGNRDSL